jgi:hypothetical protein
MFCHMFAIMTILVAGIIVILTANTDVTDELIAASLPSLMFTRLFIYSCNYLINLFHV